VENSMQKRYGLFTAISMVVGIVIGSGIFFKATKVLANNNGDMGRSLLTVGIVGAIMLICSFVFANLASRYEITPRRRWAAATPTMWPGS